MARIVELVGASGVGKSYLVKRARALREGVPLRRIHDIGRSFFLPGGNPNTVLGPMRCALMQEKISHVSEMGLDPMNSLHLLSLFYTHLHADVAAVAADGPAFVAEEHVIQLFMKEISPRLRADDPETIAFLQGRVFVFVHGSADFIRRNREERSRNGGYRPNLNFNDLSPENCDHRGRIRYIQSLHALASQKGLECHEIDVEDEADKAPARLLKIMDES